MIGRAAFYRLQSKEILHQGQRTDARKTQKACYYNRDSVDGKVKTREGSQRIEQPQAQKTAGRIDAELPEPPDGQRDNAQHNQKQNNGNDQRCKFFHRNLRISMMRMHIIVLDNGRTVLQRT